MGVGPTHQVLYKILGDGTKAGLEAKILAEAKNDDYFKIYGGVTFGNQEYIVLVRYSSPKAS